MSRLTDEILSAYIDGELPPAEAARVALELTRNPEAYGRLNALRASDALLRDAFECPTSGQKSLADRFIAETKRTPEWRRPGVVVAVTAVGVIALSTAAFMAGKFSAPRDVRFDSWGEVLAPGDLAHALETQASDAAGAVRIPLTFRAKDGRFCREFVTGDGVQGLACREGGDWRLQALGAETDAVHTGRTDVNLMMATIGVGAVIQQPQQRRLIGAGWRDGQGRANPAFASQ